MNLKDETSPPKKNSKKGESAAKRRRMSLAQNKALLVSAINTAKKTRAKSLFIYIDALEESLLVTRLPVRIPSDLKLILVTKKNNYSYSGDLPIKDVVTIPRLKLGRMGLVKISVVFALSTKLIESDERIVFLLGKSVTTTLDMILCLQLNEESELLTGHSIAEIPDTINSAVFEYTLSLAIEMGNKGKEGKPVGTIFVLGDEERVMQLSKQMIINPFKGYEPDERNILNPALKETLRELSSVDGAFVITGDGEILTAGRYLGAAMEDSDIPRGLGARHLAAAGITALTNAVAIVISESTGDVRIFRNGKIVMEIEKPIHNK